LVLPSVAKFTFEQSELKNPLAPLDDHCTSALFEAVLAIELFVTR
jgi:hypothetical protein